ncbi:hypothetical protein LCN96_50920 [Nonomuraea gerenzanensis]|nr:hypothetical protein [Nonomuraea gerenzanensis]UBU12503.1 hypothetical protein LCN96_50920 [Nonomuraea gerenzanensis]
MITTSAPFASARSAVEVFAVEVFAVEVFAVEVFAVEASAVEASASEAFVPSAAVPSASEAPASALSVPEAYNRDSGCAPGVSSVTVVPSAVSRAASPARSNEDLPLPVAPRTTVSGPCCTAFSSTSSRSSRPKNRSAASTSSGSRPG